MDPIDVIDDFIRVNPSLRALYLMQQPSADTEMAEDLNRFLLFFFWFICDKNKVWSFDIIISREMQKLMTQTDADGRNLAMICMAHNAGLNLPVDELRAWYYFKALPRYGLFSLFGRNDRFALMENTSNDNRCKSARYLQALADAAMWTNKDNIKLFDLIISRCIGMNQAAFPTVSIIGFSNSVLGIGEDARCLHRCLSYFGIFSELVDVSPVGLERHEDASFFDAFTVKRPTGSVVIFCLPMFETMRAIASLHLKIDKLNQYWVGYWPWETTSHPLQWRFAYQAMNEIWASSNFLRSVFERETTLPVRLVPLHVSIEEPAMAVEVSEVFDQRFCFLGVFDFNSRIERKNPEGAIKAFQLAFPDADVPVCLILKTIHGDNQSSAVRKVLDLIGADKRIVIVDGALSKAEVCGMISQADAYLSMHRSEGFGRPIVEAMLLGTTVIATEWSGSADFVNNNTAFPIRSELREVRLDEYPYASGQWAEPNIEHAAELMREVYRNPGLCKKKAEYAKKFAMERFGVVSVSSALACRLEAIQNILKTNIAKR